MRQLGKALTTRCDCEFVWDFFGVVIPLFLQGVRVFVRFF